MDRGGTTKRRFTILDCVPMVLQWPGHSTGSQYNGLLANIDLAPRVLIYAY